MIWALAFPVGFVYIFWRFWFKRQKVCAGGKQPGAVRSRIQTLLDDPDQISYDVKDVHAPRVAGLLFKIAIWLAYTRVGRYFIIPLLKRSSNLHTLDGLLIPEYPTLYPNPVEQPTADHSQSQANDKLLNELVNQQITSDNGEGFRFNGVADFVRVYRSGELTPTQVTEAVLSAIAHSDGCSPPLRAVVQSNREVVLAQAQASTQRWSQHKPLSLLDGVPVAIKEEFRVEPYEFRGGSTFVPILTHGEPESLVARRLKESGAIIVGVANMHEFGLGTHGSNPNKAHLTARNPYNPQCYPGGSSSGSAVSVAAGLCPIAVGADGGGSVRIPAAICGVVGLKPTFGLISHEGQLSQEYTMGTAGPLCSSVLDAALALDVMTREGTKSPLALGGLLHQQLEGLKIGVYWEYFDHADREIVRECRAAVSQLEALGATIQPITIPELEECRVAHFISIVSEFSSALAVDLDKHFDEMNLESLLLLIMGFNLSSVEFINAQKQRTRAIMALKHIFSRVDVIVTPATACTAPTILPDAVATGSVESTSTSQLMRFSYLANLTGIPGLSIPVGYSSQGLPIALQLMGTWHSESTLLKIGLALENTCTLSKPQVHYNVLEKNT